MGTIGTMGTVGTMGTLGTLGSVGKWELWKMGENENGSYGKWEKMKMGPRNLRTKQIWLLNVTIKFGSLMSFHENVEKRKICTGLTIQISPSGFCATAIKIRLGIHCYYLR